MVELNNYRKDVSQYGFAVIERVFTEDEISNITNVIGQADTTKATFRKTNDLFAIRQFLKEIPEVIPLVLTERLNTIIRAMSGEDYFVVKSIYFDKPGESNWFVAYHQDLTISVDKKVEMEGFGPWTVKEKQYAVQPPLDILENNFTIRIHLDDTDDKNGALRVIPESHLKGIQRVETLNMSDETEITCNVPKGGVMVMRPLLLHASGRTTNKAKRRVIHIEFSNRQLPEPLQWSELLPMKSHNEY